MPSDRPPAQLLDRHRPILVYDASEEYYAQPVAKPYAEARQVGGDRVYGRIASEDGQTWLQYWLYFAYNPQDRGILHTGRHEGDWELVQLRLGENGRPDLATLSQHSWAEGCGWGKLEVSEREAPTVYVANGSHALYAHPGVGDRPFPDPNDEADGSGREVRPPLERVRRSDPAWVEFDGHWGASRAGIVPGEQSSPLGPRFQPSDAWSTPASFHRERVRPCGAGPPGRWWTWPAVALTVLVAFAAVLLFRRRPRNA